MLWLCWLALLIAIAVGCSFLAPGSSLHQSALRAFDSSVFTLSRGGVEDSATFHSSDEGDGHSVVGASDASAPPLRSARAAPRPMLPLRTSDIRKRATPLMQKRVAARYNFKCAICNKPFTDTSLWEVDHIVPLSSARTAADVERLNSIENLQPVHRTPCHQMKTSREAAVR